MGHASRKRERWDGEFGCMSGRHDGTIGISGALFVNYREIDRQERVGATGISYSNAILNGGTRVGNMRGFILYVR